MIKAASSALDGISKWMSDNPTTTAALLTGGAGAIGGFALTKTDPNEDASTSMKRRLKNALIVGGLGAGVGALGSEAIKAFDTALPDPERTQLSKAAPWFESVGGGAAGMYGGGILGQKLVNSNLPGIGQRAETLTLAEKLSGGKEIKDIAKAREIITAATEGKDALSDLATVMGKDITDQAKKVTSIKDIAKRLGKLNIKPKNVGNADLAAALKKVKSWKRMGVIGALGALGTVGGAASGWTIGDWVHSKD